jgi:hypothetical protein
MLFRDREDFCMAGRSELFAIMKCLLLAWCLQSHLPLQAQLPAVRAPFMIDDVIVDIYPAERMDSEPGNVSQPRRVPIKAAIPAPSRSGAFAQATHRSSCASAPARSGCLAVEVTIGPLTLPPWGNSRLV